MTKKRTRNELFLRVSLLEKHISLVLVLVDGLDDIGDKTTKKVSKMIMFHFVFIFFGLEYSQHRLRTSCLHFFVLQSILSWKPCETNHWTYDCFHSARFLQRLLTSRRKQSILDASFLVDDYWRHG